MSATIPEILRQRANSGEFHHGKQWAQGVRFAANQVAKIEEKKAVKPITATISADEDPRKPDRELVWGGVANAGIRSSVRQPRWSHVCSALGVGSTLAYELCKRMGFDPDEEVGGEE